MTEPRLIFLGALDVDRDQALAIDLPANLEPEAVKAAIERANAERAEAAKRESEALAKLFLDRLAIDREPK